MEYHRKPQRESRPQDPHTEQTPDTLVWGKNPVTELLKSGRPVDTVYLAGADARTGQGWLLRLTLGGYHDRGIIRTRAALCALDLLRRMALELPVPDGIAVREDTPPEQTNL